MRRPTLLPVVLPVVIAVAACTRSGGSPSCGIAALTGPLAVKESFGRGNVLTAPPEFLPAHLPIRLVAGPAWPGSVTRDSGGGWRVVTLGTVSHQAHIGYGVLVVDGNSVSHGVLAFDGIAVHGANVLGTLAIADTIVPLLGVRVDPAAMQDARCPLFPDSLR